MRIIKIQIKNIGIISDTEIILEKGLNLFYGDVKQGKTTILNSVRWVCGGSYPNDILKHGEEEGSIHIFFDNGATVRREFYLSKVSGIKDRPVQFIKDGIVQSQPVSKLKELFNPFQLNQNHFTEMSALEKKRFAVDLFNVDTAEEEKELKTLKEKGNNLLKKMKAIVFGKEVKVEHVDIKKLTEELKKTEEFNLDQAAAADDLDKANRAIEEIDEDILQAEEKLQKLRTRLEDKKEYISKLPKAKEIKDTTALTEKISDAKLINYKADQYVEMTKENEKKENERAKLEIDIKQARVDVKAKEKEITDKLKAVNDSHGIEGLVFVDGGDFTYEGTSADMLSTSQNAKLSSALQSKYPESMAVEIIDQGESWGKSIFDLIEKAEKENKVILTTVVGEKPAKAPAKAGVFVVKDGEVSNE